MKKISEMTPDEALTEQALAVFKRRLEQARKKAVESAAAGNPTSRNGGTSSIAGNATTFERYTTSTRAETAITVSRV